MNYRPTVPHKMIDTANSAVTVTSSLMPVATSNRLTAIFKGETAGGAFRARLLVSPDDDIANAVPVDEGVFDGNPATQYLKYDGLAGYAAIELALVDAGAEINDTKGWLLVQ